MTVLNVTFHGIAGLGESPPQEEAHTWISFGQFQLLLDVLRGRPEVTVTFDDGNESDIRYAVPALIERGMRGRFFIVAERINAKGYLTAGHVREMASQGMIIGSHGMRHRHWNRMGWAELHEEVYAARDRLEEILGAPIAEAACPFGAYNRQTLRALRDAGFRHVYTSDGGPAEAGAWLQARNTVHDEDRPESVARWFEEKQRPPSVVRRIELQVKRWR